MMRSLIRLDDWSVSDLDEVFRLADEYRAGRVSRFSGCVVMFFPPTSLRTRVSFERGAAMMNLQPIVFPSETLNKREELADVIQFIQLWADAIVLRHPDITKLEQLATVSTIPVINAMTDINHPCEVLSDIYALRSRCEIRRARFVFVGADGNILRAWLEAARVLDLDLIQCCPADCAAPGATWTQDVHEAVQTADVILTDTCDPDDIRLKPYQITAKLLDEAPKGVIFNPCPPFTRGVEMSADALAHPAFVGYQFKSALLPVQQAIMAFCIGTV
jgi:ornithine carbamoyltransferase